MTISKLMLISNEQLLPIARRLQHVPGCGSGDDGRIQGCCPTLSRLQMLQADQQVQQDAGTQTVPCLNVSLQPDRQWLCGIADLCLEGSKAAGAC